MDTSIVISNSWNGVVLMSKEIYEDIGNQMLEDAHLGGVSCELNTFNFTKDKKEEIMEMEREKYRLELKIKTLSESIDYEMSLGKSSCLVTGSGYHE